MYSFKLDKQHYIKVNGIRENSYQIAPVVLHLGCMQTEFHELALTGIFKNTPAAQAVICRQRRGRLTSGWNPLYMLLLDVGQQLCVEIRSSASTWSLMPIKSLDTATGMTKNIPGP